MLSWSVRRQIFFLTVIIGAVLLFIAAPAFLVYYRWPTCGDGKQNQGEQGIDCGGPCPMLCKRETLDPVVRWQRAFKIRDGLWGATAYVENPNLHSIAYRVPYLFKFYDERNILIYERRGTTFIPPRKTFAIFESGILTGERIPTRTIFEFLKLPEWQRTSSDEPPLIISDRVLSAEEGSPRLTAVIHNQSLVSVGTAEVVAILFDEDDNAIAASKTVINDLSKGQTEPLTFTWLEPFPRRVVRIETLYRVYPPTKRPF